MFLFHIFVALVRTRTEQIRIRIRDLRDIREIAIHTAHDLAQPYSLRNSFQLVLENF